MVRLLRRLVRLGLLAGLGVGILKVVKGRKAPDPWADSWVSTGPPGGTRPSPAPVAATPKPAAPAETAKSGAAKSGPAESKAAKADTGKSGTGKAGAGKAGTGKAGAGKGDTGKAAPSRASKSTRKGPARRSPTGKAEEPPGARLWVAANDGVCPQTHPIKAKLSSKIFHTPASRNYSRTKADRCYPDEASAQADGLRPAQR
jgi:hypothetical protein